MLIHPTIERLRALGLAAMADAFIELQNAPDTAELTREDWPGLLVDREATSRENKRLDRALFLKLATCQWGIQDHHHLCVIGPTGRFGTRVLLLGVLSSGQPPRLREADIDEVPDRADMRMRDSRRARRPKQ